MLTVYTVQALLMATQYTQGTQRSSQTWDMLGRLIHAAFQVGLYYPMGQVHYGPLDAELRKRAWWMCFIMDRSRLDPASNREVDS